MAKYVIRGGNPLSGTVEVQGSKNSAVAVLLACIAVRGEVVLRRVPDITDVVDCIGIIRYLGGRVAWLPGRSLSVDCSDIKYRTVPSALTGRMRASTYMMGAFLNRFGRCGMIRAGGCSLGSRPVDLHIGAMKSLGALVDRCGEICVNGGLNGEWVFPQVTVGGTINSVIASSRGEGVCVLKNCAKEPHVGDVVRFLNACGADIEGVDTDCLTVRGVNELCGCEFVLSGDMIEAGTYLLAGAATRGRVTVSGLEASQLDSFCDAIARMGVVVSKTRNSISVSGNALHGTVVETGVFPAFPTDLHPQMVAFMGSVCGESRLRETVFGGDRFAYLEGLGKQGLEYIRNADSVTVYGGGYHATAVRATDLRGGAANLIAALCAEGESNVEMAEYVERGYSDIVLKMRSLGAEIYYED